MYVIVATARSSVLQPAFKVLPKHITKSGDISVAHPHYEYDLRRIGETQGRIEALVASYIEQYQEKPSKAWLEKAYHANPVSNSNVSVAEQRKMFSEEVKDDPDSIIPSLEGQHKPVSVDIPSASAKESLAVSKSIEGHGEVVPAAMIISLEAETNSTGLEQDVLFHWKAFIAEKNETVRNANSLKRLSNARYSFAQYTKKRNVWMSFLHLDQRFFNDYVVFMVTEQEYYRNRHQATKGYVKPSIGLNNNTAIKRLSDLMVYLRYCKVVQDVNLDLDKIGHYIEVAKKRMRYIHLKEKNGGSLR